MTASNTPTEKNTHPIRGLLWGIPFGLGLAVVLVVTQVISLELSQMFIALLFGVALGVVWGLFGPAKKPKGSPPTRRVAAPEALSESPGQPDAAEADTGEALEEGSPTADDRFRASPDDPDAADGDLSQT